MTRFNYIFLLLVIGIVSSCKPETIKPNSFFATNYTTNPNTDQEFKYFYDDGKIVANGLEFFVAKINSLAGTFSNEKILLIKYKKNITELPDTLNPFTYFIGLQYEDELNKEVEFTFDLNYQYDNPSHTDYSEYLFFKSNINKLKLFKIKYSENASYYYDPDITYAEYPFTIDNNLIKFKTKDKNALFGFCFVETSWIDTLTYTQGSLIQEQIYSSNRALNTNNDGAYVANNTFYMNYTDQTLINSTITNSQPQQFYQLNLIMDQPQQGLIDNNSIYLDLIVEENISGSILTKSYLKPTNTTQIEFIKWPNAGEKGTLKISGPMKSELSQTIVVIDLTLNFYRQR